MKLSDIDLRLLRVFQAVASAGGFARAQGVLGISQPAISTQIAKLEDRLGVRLCDRGPQGFALTPEGVRVLDEVDALLAHIDAAARRLNTIADTEVQRVRLGVVDSTVTDPNNPLVEVLSQVRQEMPNVQASIAILDFLSCLEELRAHRLDIAIVGIAGNERIPPDAETFPLYQETSNLYCSPDHPCASVSDSTALQHALGNAQISAHSFVFNPIDKDLDPALLGPVEGIAQDTIELTAYYTLAGGYVGLLPDHYAAPWVTAGKLTSLASLHPPILSEFHAVRLLPKSEIPAVDAVWAALKGC